MLPQTKGVPQSDPWDRTLQHKLLEAIQRGVGRNRSSPLGWGSRGLEDVQTVVEPKAAADSSRAPPSHLLASASRISSRRSSARAGETGATGAAALFFSRASRISSSRTSDREGAGSAGAWAFFKLLSARTTKNRMNAMIEVARMKSQRERGHVQGVSKNLP